MKVKRLKDSWRVEIFPPAGTHWKTRANAKSQAKFFCQEVFGKYNFWQPRDRQRWRVPLDRQGAYVYFTKEEDVTYFLLSFKFNNLR